MAGQRVTRVICAADARGSGEAVERLLEAAVERNAHAVSLVGDLSDGHGSPEGYRAVFGALGAGGLPAYWIPGPADAPVAHYLREAQNIEVVFPADLTIKDRTREVEVDDTSRAPQRIRGETNALASRSAA